MLRHIGTAGIAFCRVVIFSEHMLQRAMVQECKQKDFLLVVFQSVLLQSTIWFHVFESVLGMRIKTFPLYSANICCRINQHY